MAASNATHATHARNASDCVWMETGLQVVALAQFSLEALADFDHKEGQNGSKMKGR